MVSWKKATLKSLAVLSVGACFFVGWQIAGQRWPAFFTSRGMNQLGALVGSAIAITALGLTKPVEPKELLPSPYNTKNRNGLNIANLVACVIWSITFLYLAGLFGKLRFPSITFYVSAVGMLLSIAFQACFVVVTRTRSGGD